MGTTEDLTEYTGKRVIVTRNVDATADAPEHAEEIEGTAVTANELGILLKPRGKTALELIEAGTIEQVVLAPEKPSEIKARALQPVADGQVRQHLADRHGLDLSQVNALTEEDAAEYHKSLVHDKTASAHHHEAKPKDSKAPESDDSE